MYWKVPKPKAVKHSRPLTAVTAPDVATEDQTVSFGATEFELISGTSGVSQLCSRCRELAPAFRPLDRELIWAQTTADLRNRAVLTSKLARRAWKLTPDPALVSFNIDLSKLIPGRLQEYCRGKLNRPRAQADRSARRSA